MADLISLPMRLSPSGSVVTVEQGTEAYYKQQIVTIVLTLQGERPMNPDFGMPDMAFQGFMYSTFHSQVDEHLPEVTDVYVEAQDIDDVNQSVTIGFNTVPEQI